MILVRNGNVITENEVTKKDILISGDRIKKIAQGIKIDANKKVEVIDAAGKFVFPGAVDPHTHHELNLGAGRMSSDTFSTGTAAALAGGVTTIFDFAHQESKDETLKQAYIRTRKLADKAHNRVYLHGGIMNLTDDLEKQIEEAFKCGVTSFKIYLNSIRTTTEFLYRAFSKIAELKGRILLHCEDASIVEYLKKELHNAGRRSAKYIPASRPEFVEYHSIVSCSIIAEVTGAEIYIVHLSTGRGAAYIAEAQKRGVKISVETCPQYLLLTDEIYKRRNGHIFTCTPPFRKKEDNEILWKYLKNEVIKFIGTDHCPFTKMQKDKFSDSFVNYVYGLPGIQFSPVLMISEMRKRGFDYPLISRLLSTNAAKYFGLYPRLGVLKENSTADLFIYNPSIEQKLSYKNWLINSDFNQFEGHIVNGQIETVIFEGKEVIAKK